MLYVPHFILSHLKKGCLVPIFQKAWNIAAAIDAIARGSYRFCGDAHKQTRIHVVQSTFKSIRYTVGFTLPRWLSYPTSCSALCLVPWPFPPPLSLLPTWPTPTSCTQLFCLPFPGYRTLIGLSPSLHGGSPGNDFNGEETVRSRLRMWLMDPSCGWVRKRCRSIVWMVGCGRCMRAVLRSMSGIRVCLGPTGIFKELVDQKGSNG